MAGDVDFGFGGEWCGDGIHGVVCWFGGL
jgi:hypothetical protein